MTHSYYTNMRRFKRFPSNDVELGAKRTNEAVPTIEIRKCKNSLFSRLMRDNWLKLLKNRKISQLFRIMHTSRQLHAVKLSGVSGVTNRSVDQTKYFISCSLAPCQESLSSTRHCKHIYTTAFHYFSIILIQTYFTNKYQKKNICLLFSPFISLYIYSITIILYIYSITIILYIYIV